MSMETGKKTTKGDDYLCGFELNLWSLHQHVLLTWGVYTLFKWERMHVGEMRNGLILWFVPEGCHHQAEVTAFLEDELATMETKAERDWPGTDVSVHHSVALFRGVQPYLEREPRERMIKEAVTRWKTQMTMRTRTQ
jgi:hypothetical protein